MRGQWRRRKKNKPESHITGHKPQLSQDRYPRKSPVFFTGRKPTSRLKEVTRETSTVTIGVDMAKRGVINAKQAIGKGSKDVGDAEPVAITGINAEGHQKKTGDAARRHLEVKYNFSSNYSCLSEFEIQGQDFPAKGVNKSSANNVKGSLRNSISYWERIGANSGVMDLIEHGYKIPFLNNPPDGFFENNKSALKNRDFVEKEINSHWEDIGG